MGLQDMDIEILHCQNGDELIQSVKSDPPSMIFADILIKKKNGYQIARELKEDSKTSHIPIVLMSSAFMELDQDQYKSCGAKACLEKPFNVESLRKIVQSLSKNMNPVKKEVESQSSFSFQEKKTNNMEIEDYFLRHLEGTDTESKQDEISSSEEIFLEHLEQTGTQTKRGKHPLPGSPTFWNTWSKREPKPKGGKHPLPGSPTFWNTWSKRNPNQKRCSRKLDSPGGGASPFWFGFPFAPGVPESWTPREGVLPPFWFGFPFAPGVPESWTPGRGCFPSFGLGSVCSRCSRKLVSPGGGASPFWFGFPFAPGEAPPPGESNLLEHLKQTDSSSREDEFKAMDLQENRGSELKESQSLSQEEGLLSPQDSQGLNLDDFLFIRKQLQSLILTKTISLHIWSNQQNPTPLNQRSSISFPRKTKQTYIHRI